MLVWQEREEGIRRTCLFKAVGVILRYVSVRASVRACANVYKTMRVSRRYDVK